jgi:chromosome segregation ATPase
MPTKHQLEQQLEETRADLAFANERLNAQLLANDEMRRELRETGDQRDNLKRMADASQIRALNLEADVARLTGHIEGMRYMIRLEKGLKPHEDPLPSSEGRNPFESIGDRFADLARGLGR